MKWTCRQVIYITIDEERRVNGNIVSRICGRPDLIEPTGSPSGAEPLDKTKT